MLTSAWTPLRYHRGQSDLWRTNARFVACACGRGSGKTEIARRRVVRFLPVRKPWRRPMYFYGLPTYKQARRVAWKNIIDLIPEEWVAKLNHSEMLVETVFGSELYVVGLDKPQRIEGDQWDGGVLDESCDMRPGTFDLSVFPALTHKEGWCWRIGVPKRAGVGAADFRNFCEKRADEYYNWPSSDILTERQLSDAMDRLDDRDYEEQFEAKWTNASGAIFHAFDERENVTTRAEYHESLPIIVGSDFNVDPMAWILSHHVDGELHVFDELFLRNTNTQETLNRLYSGYGHHMGGFLFTGDATSRARNTRASTSDYVQIKNDKRFHNSEISYSKHNPARADRFAACNAVFKNARGTRRCFIHPRCVHLIEDLRSRAYKQGTNEPDDHDDVSHASDAFGYTVMKMFPVRVIHERDSSDAGVYASVN